MDAGMFLANTTSVYVHIISDPMPPRLVIPARTQGLLFRRTNPAISNINAPSLRKCIKRHPVAIHLVTSEDDIDLIKYNLCYAVFDASISDPAIRNTARRFAERFLGILKRIEQAITICDERRNAARAFMTSKVAVGGSYDGPCDALANAFTEYVSFGKMNFRVNRTFIDTFPEASTRMRMEWGAKAAIRAEPELCLIAETLIHTMRGKVFIP